MMRTSKLKPENCRYFEGKKYSWKISKETRQRCMVWYSMVRCIDRNHVKNMMLRKCSIPPDDKSESIF